MASTKNKRQLLKVSDWRLLVSFFHYVRPYKRYIGFSLAAIPFSIGAAVAFPFLIVRIIDNYVLAGNQEGLYLMVGLLAGAVLIGFLADSIYTLLLQKSGHMGIARMREKLFNHSLRLPRSYYDKHPIGVTLSRLTSDVESIGESLAIGVLSLLTDFIKAVALFILLFYLSWKLTLVILLIIPPVYLLATLLRKKLRVYFNISREALAAATGYLQECLNGIKTIQLYAAEEKVLQRFVSKNKRFFKAQKKSNIYDAGLFSVIDGLTSITLALIIWYGSGQILKGLVTIGVLIGFISTLSRIFVPIREFTQQISIIQRALSALEHINELFSEEIEEEKLLISEKQPYTPCDFKELCFKNVSFQYSPEGPKVLNDVSFKVKRGERIAIVGATGAGKSTITRLLSKAYGNYQGSITINGLEVSKTSKKALLKIISLMQQDVYLFNESLSFNISLNQPGVDETTVRQAAKYVYANEFIDSLPEKYNYKILNNGRNLSAGQAQLISFARAIARKSEIIILDEATSSVDSMTESSIRKAIEKIFQEKTVIAIAHRLSTIQNSDMILVLKEGEIVERGSHSSLVRQGGYYCQLLKKMEPDDYSV